MSRYNPILALEGHCAGFIGDMIVAEAEVLSLHATKPVTQLKVLITRQDGKTVLEG
jgi:hypothetical protein